MDDFSGQPMLDLIQLFREHGRHEDEPPEYILCLACANVSAFNAQATTCPHCSAGIDPAAFHRFYMYATDALRYGHQYKDYYSEQDQSNIGDHVHACLAELPAVYKFIAVAIASGIIGGASWELTKSAVIRVVAQFSRSDAGIVIRQEPTIDSGELDRLAHDIEGYAQGMRHVSLPLSRLILEEIYADNTGQYFDEVEEIHKLLARPKKTEKNRKRAAKLQKRLIRKIVSTKLRRPERIPQEATALWSRLES